MASQYGDPNQNSYNPSDYEIEPFDHLFTGMRYIEENDVLSTHLQLPPEGSNAFMNQNPQNYESLNSEHPENTPMSVATPCVLPGFQHTFDRRNFISYATHPSESSVNCEKYSKDQSLGGAACTSQNMDAPQERKNPPYESSICPMQFKQKECLESHENCHSVKKTYVCRFCDKSFTRSDTLGIHIRTHTGEKSYVCSFCDKAFTRSGGLGTHIRTHTGEKPHSCKKCGKCFSDGANLNKHVHISHIDEKPYECNKCGKNYAYTPSLRRHMLKHCFMMKREASAILAAMNSLLKNLLQLTSVRKNKQK